MVKSLDKNKIKKKTKQEENVVENVYARSFSSVEWWTREREQSCCLISRLSTGTRIKSMSL